MTNEQFEGINASILELTNRLDASVRLNQSLRLRVEELETRASNQRDRISTLESQLAYQYHAMVLLDNRTKDSIRYGL